MSSFVPYLLNGCPPPLGEEPSRPECPEDLGETHLSGVQQVVLTAIRATDVTLGLRRIPAGFHVAIKTGGTECQTSNKSVHVGQAVVEWNEPILLPCEPYSIVRVSVYASFELSPMLSHGEILRTFEISVGELLDRSEKSHPIIFKPKQDEIVSSCTTIFMTVEQRCSDKNAAAVLCPHTTLTSDGIDALVLETDAGHRLLARYRRTQDNGDLDQSIKHFECALGLCPMEHPSRPAVLFNLATAKFVSHQANGTYLDLDIPITLFEDALKFRPAGHADRPITQLHLANALLSYFAKWGLKTDADAAEELLREVLRVCHSNSHVYRAALLAIETSAQLHLARNSGANDVGQERPVVPTFPLSLDQLPALVQWCLVEDDPRTLNGVIFLHYHALRYYNPMHASRAQLICNLGVMLRTRFQRQGNIQDLNEAVKFLTQALALCPRGHPDRSKPLHGLGIVLSARFEHRGNVQDLDDTITLRREVLALCPVGHTDRSVSLSNLADTLSILFKHRGNAQDSDEAITLHREALALRPVGHLDRAKSLHDLAMGLYVRFEHRGNGQDLDEAITLYRESLALCPVGHPDRSKPLHGLASTLSARFKHRGNSQDLDQTITLRREVLALCPVGHTDRSVSLSSLADTLSILFKHRGNVQDLDEAITLHMEALALRPVGHPDRSVPLSGIANGLSTRFEHRGNVQDLNEAIPLHREALALHPVGHPDRSVSLNNLARGLCSCFDHRGNDQDLDEAITLFREALALCPVGQLRRSIPLDNLASTLSTRFDHRGNGQDLDDAITLNMEALALRPVGNPLRVGSLSNYANRLSTRFHLRGNYKDLDDAIMLHREVLAFCPVGHPDRPISLHRLADQLSTRCDHRDNGQDLDEAIVLYREMLALLPVPDPRRSTSLNNLANQLSARVHHRDNDEDLDEAIALQMESLALRPVGHIDRSTSLDNLGSKLAFRFRRRGNDKDLDDAITLHREALALRPVGHPHRSISFHNLGLTLGHSFKHRRNQEDLDESLESLQSALTLLRQHDPFKVIVHDSLAQVFLLFHQSGLDGTGEHLNAAMHYFKAAANIVSGGLPSRLRASIRWVCHAHDYTHGTELEAYATYMQLLDTHMSVTASVSSRHNVMKDFPSTLVVDAVSCALRSGDVCRAVELLEQGRTVIWTQMTRLRTPLDSLQERGDHAVVLMKKFRDLSSLLETPPANHTELEGTPRVDVEAEASRYTRLLEDWNRVVEEIRKIEGFSRFLLPPLFSDLQDAARDGPIIVLVASESSCDAIIIPHKQPPTSIQLPTNLEKLPKLVSTFQQAVQRDASPKRTQPELIKALRELWNDVVRPVVENLGRFARPGSRIWWCPTSLFNFLPLHAAGEYRGHGQSLSQLYISSYTPSLTALIRARRSHDKSLSVSFAAIGQNHPAGHSFTLDCVEPELELVRSLLPPPPTASFTKITSIDATKSRALRVLQDNTWLHFACHGTQNYTEPFKSAFLMRDQPLSLLDITETDLSLHEFAFLSACETAVGDSKTPDEVVHLAAGLQFAGVKSVVGTLWNVNDATVQRLVEAFYKNFCGDGKMNSKRAARALHRAVQSLACDKDIPLDQRIVFMHIGI